MLIPVILSGGAGTRLWPVSREAHPKPFIRLPDGSTLLGRTYRRAAALPWISEVVTVTNRDLYFRTKDEYHASGSTLPATYLLEPEGRNTAPAVALAAHHCVQRHGPDAVMLILSADHLIDDQAAFAEAVRQAKELAQQGHLVTFGIRPETPQTGFGYLEVGPPLQPFGHSVVRFVEKPDAATAAQYVASGRHLWNSGMFCFQAARLLEVMERVCPDVATAARDCWAATAATGTATLVELHPATFARHPDISIDYAVMERADGVAVVPCSIGWSDVGSWNALAALVEPDGNGNRADGQTVLVDTADTYVHAETRLVATVGVERLIIVDTDDALLVAHKDRVQDVRLVVQRLKQQGHEAYRLHRTVVRPWGTYTVLEEGPRFKIKRIEVKPGASLSLQMHHHRSEHWIVVSGMAKVVNGDKEFYVGTNESTFIPAGHRHRLENPGKLDLVMIEVQSGEYLGEDDIVRFSDRYGRA